MNTEEKQRIEPETELDKFIAAHRFDQVSNPSVFNYLVQQDNALTSANEQIEQLKNDLADALDLKNGNGPTALSRVVDERNQLRAENEQLKKTIKEYQDERRRLGKTSREEYNKLCAENDKLRKERDEELKSFYRWVIFDNDSLPTNSTDLDNLISEYKKTREH